MKKKRSALAIIVAVIFNLILFPMVLGAGMMTMGAFSAEKILQPGREKEIFDCFMDNGGSDWLYEELLANGGLGEFEFEEGVEITVEELFPKDEVDVIVEDVIFTLLNGENYQFDLSLQKSRLKAAFMEYFEREVDAVLREEYGEAYELATEAEKEEAKQEIRKEYEAEMDAYLEEEVASLEEELSATINEFYESDEYKEFKQAEADFGFSFTEREPLCDAMKIVGYVAFVFVIILLVLVALCHLFRPSGLFVAGGMAFLVAALAGMVNKFFPTIVYSTLYEEIIANELPESLANVVQLVIDWFASGFGEAAMYHLIAGIVCVVWGVLAVVRMKSESVAE